LSKRPFPDVVRIEPAGLCNFHCQHCPIGLEGGHRLILRYDRFVEFFRMLPAVPRELVLYHGGEPLLNKNLERMIAYAKDAGVHKVVLNTNASLLNERRDFSRLDELRISFDGESMADNDRIRIGSHFEQHAVQVRLLASSPPRPSARCRILT
jgi:MoaA/NifB/PqqE/SkfB family radical SAM enzyme